MSSSAGARKTPARRGRGKGARGRGAKKCLEVEEDQNGLVGSNSEDGVPELGESSPPSVAVRQIPVRNRLRLKQMEVTAKIENDENDELDYDIAQIMDQFSADDLKATVEEEEEEECEKFESEGQENNGLTTENNENHNTEEEMITNEAEMSNAEEAKSENSVEEDAKSEEVTSSKVDPKSDETNVEMTVLDEVTCEESGVGSDEIDENKSDGPMEDTEMVSEDELPVEVKEPLDTEAVSDEELPDSSVRESEDLLDTEAVSDDELPPDADKKRKRKKPVPAECEAVSEDELPDDKKDTQETAKAEVAPVEGSGEEGQKVEGGVKRKMPVEGEYDPSSPTSETSQDDVPAAKKAALADGKAVTVKPTGKKALPELDKYWKAVNDDPTDFTGWTYLLQYVDQENEIEAARDAYDAFLSHYPYCYGYWRKYADYEKKKGNNEKCEEVFDRGLKAIPLSVDLWLHYLNYCKVTYAEDEERMRAQFERAVQACGLEFRSDRLWESYIKWETEGKRLTRITALYDKLLATPTQGYTTHFDNFQEHVSSNPPQTILPVDDFLEVRREVLQMLKQYDAPAAAVAVGEDAPPGAEPEEGAPAEDKAPTSVATRMDEETAALRERIVSSRRKVHKVTVAAVAARWNFEEGIKRPYFHVKPLERCQLKNWKEYLDFEINEDNKDRIVTLFERCLIACALYEEFWIRFIRYLECIPEEDMTDKIRDVYERACLIHHKKKPNLHLLWAVFEESKGFCDKAATILDNLEKAVPNLLQVAYRKINLERRKGDYDKVVELYEAYLAASKNKAIITNMTIKYARFLWKILNDIEKAISVLKKAVEKDRDNTRLYLQMIDMGLQRTPVDEKSIIDILEQFLEKEGEPEQKLMFAQRKIEFLEDFGSDISTVQKAHDEYQKYLKQVKDKKKKSSDDHKESHSSKKSKSEHSAAPPLPPAGSTTAPYPATGYSQSYPGYTQGQYPQGYNYSGYSHTQGQDANYQGNYQNWTYPTQGNYNYSQTGWGTGYYGNY